MLKRMFYLFFMILSLSSQISHADNRSRISINALPFVNATADIDPDEFNGGILFNHELENGKGFGLRISTIENHSSETDVFSVAYYQSYMNDKANSGRVRSHSMYLEGAREYNVRLQSNLKTFGALLIGAGLTKFNFRHNQSKEWAGAAETGFQLGVKIADHIIVSGGATYYLWGYPTETIGYGFLIGSEIGVEF